MVYISRIYTKTGDQGDTGLGDGQRVPKDHLRVQAEPVESLTPREGEVLRLVAAGFTNPQIASALFVSRKTAEHHVSNILAKLGVASRTEAATAAVRLGLAAGQNGLARDHRRYLARGGLGFVLGDGRLDYGRERVLEAYYSRRLSRLLAVTPV